MLAVVSPPCYAIMSEYVQFMSSYSLHISGYNFLMIDSFIMIMCVACSKIITANNEHSIFLSLRGHLSQVF